jgi:hypothetical protein
MLTAEGLKIQKNGARGGGRRREGRTSGAGQRVNGRLFTTRLMNAADPAEVPGHTREENQGDSQDAGDEDIDGGYFNAEHPEDKGTD